jgi:hypothetical protein
MFQTPVASPLVFEFAFLEFNNLADISWISDIKTTLMKSPVRCSSRQATVRTGQYFQKETAAT